MHLAVCPQPSLEVFHKQLESEKEAEEVKDSSIEKDEGNTRLMDVCAVPSRTSFNAPESGQLLDCTQQESQYASHIGLH